MWIIFTVNILWVNTIIFFKVEWCWNMVHLLNLRNMIFFFWVGIWSQAVSNIVPNSMNKNLVIVLIFKLKHYFLWLHCILMKKIRVDFKNDYAFKFDYSREISRFHEFMLYLFRVSFTQSVTRFRFRPIFFEHSLFII